MIIVILLSALIVLGVIAALLSRSRGGKEEPVKTAQSCSTCIGTDPLCEQECMMKAATEEVEYYDDEELDTYRGRPSDQYTDAEAQEFADVLYTMRPDEVKGWSRSLILRGINMPDQIKDEAIMLMEEQA